MTWRVLERDFGILDSIIISFANELVQETASGASFRPWVVAFSWCSRYISELSDRVDIM